MNIKHCRAAAGLIVFAIADAPSHGTSTLTGGYDPCTTFTPVYRKVEEADHGRQMDAGGEAPVNRWTYWRVYAMEWHGVQLRNGYGCRSMYPR